jgi:SAM-dependent methyltransferase
MDRIDDFYLNYYEDIFGKGIVGLFARTVHRIIEFPYKKNVCYDSVLEVGAGQGEHRPFVKHQYKNYIETDLRIQKNKTPVINDQEVIRINSDAENLNEIQSNSIDRLIATCILVHLLNPDKALTNWKRVVTSRGSLTIFVPTEPGIVLRLFRFLVTSRKAKKLGLDHKSIHYREHRNMWIYCNILIYDIFKGSRIKHRKYPLKFLAWNFRLFDVYHIEMKGK